jgi:predicted transcriptional regulator
MSQFISILIETNLEHQMSEHEIEKEILPLLKALADKNRLKIIGLLAQRSHTVEELSSALKVGASTASHHLSVLGKAGLVSGKAQGYYSVYSLQTGQLEETAKRLLKPEKLTNIAEETTEDAFEKKVLATFTSPDGRITAIPMQKKKFLVLLRYLIREFRHDALYTEKQLNRILEHFNEDTAQIRRGFVENGFMAREAGGGKYWRIDREV